MTSLRRVWRCWNAAILRRGHHRSLTGYSQGHHLEITWPNSLKLRTLQNGLYAIPGDFLLKRLPSPLEIRRFRVALASRLRHQLHLQLR